MAIFTSPFNWINWGDAFGMPNFCTLHAANKAILVVLVLNARKLASDAGHAIRAHVESNAPLPSLYGAGSNYNTLAQCLRRQLRDFGP